MLAELTMAGMMQQARSVLRVDWTIPATWVIGLIIAVLINIGVVLWRGATISTQLENAMAVQKIDVDRMDAVQTRMAAADSERARMAQEMQALKDRMDVHARRLERIEEIEMHEGVRYKSIHSKP